MDTFPSKNLAITSLSHPDAESTTSKVIKKRIHASQTVDDSIIVPIKKVKRPPRRSSSSIKVPLTATHELRLLRAQVKSMEADLHKLKSKWARDLPDKRILATAQRSAFTKCAAAQTQATQDELQEMLLQQQLMFATLQTAIWRAPLHSSGQDILKSLHFDTRLRHDTVERSKVLLAHSKRSLATIPSIVHRFTQLAIDKALASKDDEDATIESVLPLSRIDITGCKDYTLVSSVFVSEIPHSSLEDVYAAALAYLDAIPEAIKRHVGAELTRTRLNKDNDPAGYWRLELSGVGLPATVNHIVCSELIPSHGVIHMDAVMHDTVHPVLRGSDMEFGIAGLTITPQKEDGTDKTVATMLRWVVLYCYNLLPNDPALRRDLEYTRPILNGDLIIASVCSYLRQLQHQRAMFHQSNE
uniref:START domain-containing protein n=1 Tax=Hyaloperonospora arabidopsidis (strain Emoy2) TaxID=559515 RepID=M4BKB1_HYAAE